MEKQDFNWTANESKDDFTCKIDDFCLRAEQLQENIWWWCVYIPDGESLDSYTYDEWCKTGDEAKQMAQNSFLSLRETKLV